MRQVVLDTETTGLSPHHGHKLTDIGCVEIINRRITGKTFQTHINPEREIDERASQITGLTWDMLRDKPVFAKIVDKLIDFIGDAELIIHNAPFDMGFLVHEFNLIKHPFSNIIQEFDVIDTLLLARDMHPGQRNSLDALCKRYNIDNSHRNYHGALLDAEILAQVYLAMTGGQSSLDLDATIVREEFDQTIILQNNQAAAQHNLAVIYANEQEKAAHAAMMALIKKEK